MYILTLTAKRRNAKRHIIERSVDIEALRNLSNNINDKYIVEIYTGRWELVERIK